MSDIYITAPVPTPAESYEIGRAHGIAAERERINGIIEQFIENSDYPEVVSSLQWLQDVIKEENSKGKNE